MRLATVCHPAQGRSVARFTFAGFYPGAEVISVRVASFAPAVCSMHGWADVAYPAYFGCVMLGRSAVVSDAARSGGVCAGVGGCLCGLVVAKLVFV